MNLLQFASDAYQNSASKGFWENRENRSKGEMVALMVSELSEAIEAHRKRGFQIIGCTWDRWKELYAPDDAEGSRMWAEWFINYVKDTIGDELADTTIRILDYVQGWDTKTFTRTYRKETTGNFAHDVLRIQWYIIQAFHDDLAHDWGYSLAAIEAFCNWYQIDLEWHIQQKMRYNSTRPYKHNKAY